MRPRATLQVAKSTGASLLLLACLVGWPGRADQPASAARKAASAPRVVYLGGGLSEEQTIVFTSAVVAAGHGELLLLDGPKAGPYLKDILDAFHPDRIIPIGSFAGGETELERRLGKKTDAIVPWSKQPSALWDRLGLGRTRVVVAAAQPRRLLLQAACLAGILHAPLVVAQGDAAESAALADELKQGQTREVVIAGDVNVTGLENVRLTRLADAEAVAKRHVHEVLQSGSIHSLVVANPTDTALGRMSSLAPWVALEHHAALLLTNEAGNNTEEIVRRADALMADTLILVAGLKAIPMERRPNPARGKDADIPMEPMTPRGDAPFSYATGRLFHEDPAIITLMAARARLLREVAGRPGPRKALIVSNPGGGLPLLETFSRNTARELRNRGYDTTARFEEEVKKDEVRRLVPLQDVFLWEGHYRTLVDEYELPKWTESLKPSLVFFQSCLALNEAEAQPLLQRGAVAVVGSPARMYSGSGGAFTLAFFDAMFYDGQSLGGALRQAKNFLLGYSILKEQRLGEVAKLGGANLRSAWAFTLWGDPTLTLPRPAVPANAMPGVTTELHGRTIVFQLPHHYYDKVSVEKYDAQMMPNSRLAGLLAQERGEEDRRRFVPFLYAEVPLPTAPVGHKPSARSRLPERHWVFIYDERRRCAYVLVTPRPRDEREIRFHISWDE